MDFEPSYEEGKEDKMYIYYTTADKITLYDTERDVNDIYFKDRDEKYQHLFLSNDVSSDSKYVIAGSERGTVRLWSIPNKTLLADIKIHNNSILSCCFSPDNKYLLTGSMDNVIRLWKVDHDKHKLKVLSAVNIKKINRDNTHEFMSCDFSPDGSFILINSYNSVLFVISIRDFEDNNLHNKVVIPTHKPTYTYCMSPDNKYICIGIDNSLFVYTNTLLQLIPNILESKEQPEYKVNFCKYSYNGLILCSTYSNGKIVLINKFGKEEIDVSPLSCGEFSFSRDDKHLIVVCGLSTIKIFDIATKSELYEITTRDTIEHCGFLDYTQITEPIQPVLDEIKKQIPKGKFIGIESFIEGVEPDYRCTFPAMKIIPFLIRISKKFLSGVLCNVRTGIHKKKKFNSTIEINYNNNIYKKPKVTFPKNLLENIKTCSENLIILFLNLENVENNVGHANMLIIDKEEKTIERFEPNGRFIIRDLDLDSNLNSIIQNYFSSFKGYTFLDSLNVCLNTNIKDKYCRLVDEGLCVVYSTMYAFLKLINHSYFRGNPMSQMFIKDYIMNLNLEDVHKFMGYMNKYISDKEANEFFMSEDIYDE